MPNAFDDLPPLPGQASQNAFDDLPPGGPEASPQREGFMSFIGNLMRSLNAPVGNPLQETDQLTKGAPIFAQALAQGATLGTADELLAGAGIGEGETFEERRQEHIRPYQEFREEGGIPAKAITSAIEGTGGLLTGFGMPGMIRNTGSRVGNFLRRTAESAIQGAGVGAAYGAGTAEPGERTEGAAQGAKVGMGLGAATPAVLSTARGVGSLVSPVATRAVDIVRPPQSTAERMLAKDIADSGETVDALSTKAIAASRESAPVKLLDILPAFQARAQSVYASGGPGGEKVRKELTDRAVATDNSGGPSRAYRRITRTLNNIVAGRTNWRDAQEALRANVQVLAKPAYEEAYRKSVFVNDEMANILKTPDGKAAVAQAERIGANEAAGTGAPFNRVDLDQIIAIVRGGQSGPIQISVQGADLIKRSLDAVAQNERNNAFGKAGLGRTTDVGRSIEKMRSRWLDNVDGQLGGKDVAVNPYYRARKQYQGAAQANSAMNIGMRVNRYTREELAEEMRNMSAADRLHLRFGLMNNLRNLSSKSGARATRLLRDEGYNEKMQMILGDDYRRVRAFLETEKSGEESARVVMGGSPTQPRLAAERRLESEQQELDDLLIGTIAGKPSSILSYGTGAFKRAVGPSEDTNKELARMLTTEGGSGIASVLKRLGVRMPEAMSSEQRDALARALLTGGVTGVGSAAQ